MLEKLHLSGLTFDLVEVERLLDGIDEEDRATQYPKLKMLGLTGVYTGFWTDGRTQQTQLLAHARLSDIEELILNLNTDIAIDDMIAQIVSGKSGCASLYIERTKGDTNRNLQKTTTVGPVHHVGHRGWHPRNCYGAERSVAMVGRVWLPPS